MHSAATSSVRSHRPCAACGADNSVVCHHQKFVVPEGYPLPATYDVVVCRRCSFVYADAGATQHDYDCFYTDWSKYDDATASTGGGVSSYDAARLAITASDIARALPNKSTTILDAGCATGGLLSALRDEGFTSLAGLDPSPRCAASCRNRGFPAHVGSIGSASADMPKFDCIVLSHVLEHVYDMPAFFTAVQRLLTPGGHLYLETPDATRYAEYLSAPFQEFNTEHINHFSARALKNTARRFGFSSVLVEQKILQTSEDIQYPAVFGVFRDLGVAAQPSDIIRDPDLPGQISDYIQKSAAMMARINLHVASQLAGQQPIIVWGAGQLAMKLLGLPCMQAAKIRALVDNNPVFKGKTLAGAPILAPSAIARTREPILLATMLHGDAIAAQIRSLGLTNRILRLLPSPTTTVRPS